MAATFGGLVLTNVGRNLLTRAQTGEKLKILRIEMGDGELGSSESILTLTRLKHKLFDCEIISKQIINDKMIISYMFGSREEGFLWREFGVIAEDPDTHEEVLYGYANARDNAEYIPPIRNTRCTRKKSKFAFSYK